jgi:NitT/TauT family transport system substrate-binding protein
MSGTPKAIRRLVTGAVIASTILLRPGASNALDDVTFTTDFGYNGRHAYFFVALDRGYYRDAGLEVKIVRGQGDANAIRQIGAGNAMFGFADPGNLILARANDRIPVKLVAVVYRKPPQAIFCREDSGLRKPKDLEFTVGEALLRSQYGPGKLVRFAYSDAGLSYYGSGIVATDVTIASKPDLVRRFVAGDHPRHQGCLR